MAAYSYAYKVKGLQHVSAQTCGEVFETLEKSETGLTPQALVDASRSDDAPLHGEFEWDDEVAAEAYRCDQARKMILNVVIVKADESGNPKDPVRAYVSAPGGKGQYVAMKSALSNEVWKAHLLMEARREMEQFVNKYKRIEELASVVNAITEYLQ